MSKDIKKAQIIVIGDEVFTLPFKLTGIGKIYTVSRGEEGKVKEVVEDVSKVILPDTKIILIVEEEYSKYVQDLILKYRFSTYPIIIPIPGPQLLRKHDPRKYYLDKARKVLGISIELG